MDSQHLEHAAEPQAHGNLPQYYYVWVGLLVLTVVEVLLAYFRLPLGVMLIILLMLSVIKAGLIMAWFMHLKFERFSLVLTIIPAMVICITLMFASFPESFRILQLGAGAGR